ncbi:MAG: TIGR03560 family F420-dependent LLM class oxidoreductase [Actinobacteria bacterium]|nr:TIGR03560 family F420-dependent LLM class oxidoreductase [Actinomycetota bacterium]
MDVALMIEGQEGVTWEHWVALADACERHGVGTLFRSDHYISQLDEDANVAHDAWTAIAALAASSTNLRLGTMVSPATFRPPTVLANAAATADHVSGGRIELGLGAGWMEREHRAYGFPFPETPVRVEMFAEQLEIVHRLWTEEGRVDFRGRHYTLEDAPAQPKPVQRPRPPLIVGGSGGRGTVEPALRFADEYNTPFASPEEAARIKAKVPGLRFSVMTGFLVGETHEEMRERAHELYSRRPREQGFDDWLAAYSERAVAGSVEEVVARLRDYEQVGCDRVLLQHLLHTDLEPVRLLGQAVRPALAP